MTNKNDGGSRSGSRDDAIAELDAVWERFEDRLRAYLSTMVDPGEGDHLLIELADADVDGELGCRPYAQFAAFGDGRMIRAEVSGDAYLLPQYRLGEDGSRFFASAGWSGNDAVGTVEDRNWHVERSVDAVDGIADQVARAFRSLFGVIHPQLLTYQAWGPAAGGAALLELCATAEVPPEPSASDTRVALRGNESVMSRLALEPDDHDELLHIVESLLREKYEAEPTIDEDGDFVLHHSGQPLWVRVRTDQPAVEIMARVAHDVHSRRSTAVELSLLNRDSLWVSWTLRDRTIWQTTVVPGYPFVPRHLDAMLDLFLEAMTCHRDDLAFRTGAKVG